MRSLENTTTLVQRLVDDIREGEIDFATLKTELRILVGNVKELSGLSRDSEDSISELNTKVAVLERIVEEIEDWIKNRQQKDNSDIPLKVAEKAGRWQTITAITTGVLGLTTAIITLIVNLFVKN